MGWDGVSAHSQAWVLPWALHSRPPAGQPFWAGRGLALDTQGWWVCWVRSGASSHAGEVPWSQAGHSPVRHPGHTELFWGIFTEWGCTALACAHRGSTDGSEVVARPSALALVDVDHGGAGRAQTLAGRAPRGGRFQLGDDLGQRLPLRLPL